MSGPAVRVSLVAIPLLVIAGCSGASHRGAASSSGEPGVSITYSVTDDTSSPPVTSTVVTESASPFYGKTLTYSGASTHSPLVSGMAYTDDGIYSISSSGALQQTQVIAPGPAPLATHLDVALPLALQEGLVSRDGTSSVVGMPCTQWHSQEPLDSADFAKADPQDFTISCVTSSGLLLEDSWTIGGRLARHRVAIAVTPLRSFGLREVLAGPSPAPAPAGAEEEVVAPVTLNEDGLGIVSKAPQGYELVRSVSVTESIEGGTAPVVARIGEVDAYQDGSDLMVLRRTKDTVGDALPTIGGQRVSLGALGTGYLTPTGTGVSITSLTKGGVLVTATSTTSAGSLVGWLRGLSVEPSAQ